MNKINKAVIALTVGLCASGAEANGVFHTVNGYTGTAVFQASGACKSKVVYENATYGTVFNSSDVQVGTGLVSADGQFLADLDTGLKLASFQASDGIKYSNTYYVDFSSAITNGLFEQNGGCTIQNAFANTKSRLVYSANFNKGLDQATLKYSFIGFLPLEVVKKGGDDYGKSKAFTGSITFKGKKSVT